MVDRDSSAVASLTKFVKAHPNPETFADANKPNPDWDNDCALFCFRYGQWLRGAAFAPVGNVSTAYDVWLGSTKQGDHGHAVSAPAFAVHFFEDVNGGLGYKAPRPGHVGIGVGGEWMICASVSSSGSPVAGVAHVRLMTVSQYAAEHQDEKYLGWTVDYAKAKFVVATPTNKRTVAAGGVQIRTAPTSKSSSRGVAPAGKVLTFDKYVVGENVKDDPYWLYAEGNASQMAGWYWLGAMTDPHTAGIPLGTYTPPETPPVTTPPADPPVDTDPPADPPTDPPVDDPAPPIDTPSEPEGPGEADPAEPDDPTPSEPTDPAKPKPVGGIVALVVAVLGLVGGVLAAIFGTR